MNQPHTMQTSAQATPPDHANAAKQTPPACLFIALFALAIITVLGLFSALARGSIPGCAAVVCNLALILGLVLGHRWAYVLVILFSVAGIAVVFNRSASQGVLVLIGDAFVLVPVLLSTRCFIPGETTTEVSRKP